VVVGVGVLVVEVEGLVGLEEVEVEVDIVVRLWDVCGWCG
jgi:hypothetical protein